MKTCQVRLKFDTVVLKTFSDIYFYTLKMFKDNQSCYQHYYFKIAVIWLDVPFSSK